MDLPRNYADADRRSKQPGSADGHSIIKGQGTRWAAAIALTVSIALGGLAAASAPAEATSPSPHAIHHSQPDGTEVVLFIRGNETFHWEEDANGYTVLFDRGRYVYARRNARGQLEKTDWEVGKANPKALGLQKHTLPSQAVIRRSRAAAPGGSEDPAAESSAPAATGPSGVVVNLVVPIRFSNHTGRSLPSQGDLDVLFNAIGGDPSLAPTGSLRDVYSENSYGQVDLQSTVANWVTVSNSEQYYANGNSGLTSKTWEALREALDTLDQSLDFSQFDQDGDGWIDAITFLHSGYGAEWGGTDSDGTHYNNRIWSHKWGLSPDWISNEGVRVGNYHISPGLWGTSGSAIGRIGVIAHETGHFFGLPDLYDTDSSAGNGIGSYGLMANSWGFDGSQKYPPHLSPWSKIQLGWLSPTTLSAPGSYSVPAAENQAFVYRVDDGFPSGEYLLIENRQPLGFDGDMPHGGLAIWHIDEQAGYNTEGYPGQSGWPGNGNHYRIALLQADGNYNLEKGNNRGDGGDVYHGNGVAQLMTSGYPSTDAYQGGTVIDTGHEITNISVAGSNMSFDFNIADVPSDPPSAPSGLEVASVGHDVVDLGWSDNAVNEDGFELERSPAGLNSWSTISLPANSTVYSDGGLTNGTAYDYRIRAYNQVGSSTYDGPVTATTTIPTPPTAPIVTSADAVAYDQVDLNWSDAANEAGYRIERSDGGAPTEIATLPADATSYSDLGVTAGNTYDYWVIAYNLDGEASDTVSVYVDPSLLPEEVVAAGETPVHGSVTGSYLDVQQSSGSQTITETYNGNSRKNRFSQLEHIWRFDQVPGRASITLNVDAYGSSGDGDSFDFSYATSLDGPYTSLFAAKSGSAGGYQVAELPGSVAGTLYVKVQDSVRSRGNSSLDSLVVRHLYVFATDDVTVTAATGLTATGISDSEIRLDWSDATGEDHYLIERDNGSQWLTVDPNVASGSESYTVDSLSPDTYYSFRVCSIDGQGGAHCGDPAGDWTLPAGLGGITLSADGYKVKGKQKVDLTWSGATGATIEVHRDGNLVLSGPGVGDNDGFETDHIDLKGGAVYLYQLCEAGGAPCSSTVQVVF